MFDQILSQFDETAKQAEAATAKTTPQPSAKLAAAVQNYHTGAVQHRSTPQVTPAYNAGPNYMPPAQKAASAQGQYVQGGQMALSQIETQLRAAYEAGYGDGQVV